MSLSGKRGSGSCPNCKANYFNRYKPAFCQSCNYAIGGSYVPKPKKAKGIILPAVRVSENVISVSTSNRNDRCFVSRDGRVWICLHELCKQRRAVCVQSGTQFHCEHIDKAVDHLSEPRVKHEISTDTLMAYPCSGSVRDEMRGNLEDLSARYGTACAPVVEVGDGVFVVYATASASNTLGFCHVKRNADHSSITCCGKNCRGIMSKAKQERTKSLCIHVHTLLCAIKSTPPVPEVATTETELFTSTELEMETATSAQVTNPRESTLKVKSLLNSFATSDM